ncbi:MAG: DUF192 domain-containing protein [Gammaproteobacteria bacterium]|nr:DUF192 domain-containing protein [Gammaproteobacteria bacterium]
MFILLLLVGQVGLTWAQMPQIGLPTKTLQLGANLLRVQIANTDEQRGMGLMFRQNLPTNEGMLFVFPVKSMQCFWMKNTYLPLSLAFISDSGTIVQIEDMTPMSTQSHCSREPVKYVLEVNRGWFHQKWVKNGSQVKGLDGIYSFK